MKIQLFKKLSVVGLTLLLVPATTVAEDRYGQFNEAMEQCLEEHASACFAKYIAADMSCYKRHKGNGVYTRVFRSACLKRAERNLETCLNRQPLCSSFDGAAENAEKYQNLLEEIIEDLGETSVRSINNLGL